MQECLNHYTVQINIAQAKLSPDPEFYNGKALLFGKQEVQGFSPRPVENFSPEILQLNLAKVLYFK